MGESEAAAYVRHRTLPEWGVGRILSVDPDSTVVAFFIHGGRRCIDKRVGHLEDAATPEDGVRRVLDMAARVDWHRANHNVYVIELRHDVFNERRFLEKNLGYIPGAKPCVYVGMTGLTPEERFRRHIAGIQAAYYAERYGVRLCAALYERLNPLPYDLAKEMEPELAATFGARATEFGKTRARPRTHAHARVHTHPRVRRCPEILPRVFSMRSETRVWRVLRRAFEACKLVRLCTSRVRSRGGCHAQLRLFSPQTVGHSALLHYAKYG